MSHLLDFFFGFVIVMKCIYLVNGFSEKKLIEGDATAQVIFDDFYFKIIVIA